MHKFCTVGRAKRQDSVILKSLEAGEPISRILSSARCGFPRHALGRPFLWAAHRCAAHAAYPRVDLAPLARRDYGPDQPSPPIWPCSARGLPCPRCRHRGGGLLSHRFTLTDRFPRMGSGPRFCLRLLTGREATAVCSLLHYPWPSPLRFGPLVLPGALSCGVRTFLHPA